MQRTASSSGQAAASRRTSSVNGLLVLAFARPPRPPHPAGLSRQGGAGAALAMGRRSAAMHGGRCCGCSCMAPCGRPPVHLHGSSIAAAGPEMGTAAAASARRRGLCLSSNEARALLCSACLCCPIAVLAACSRPHAPPGSPGMARAVAAGYPAPFHGHRLAQVADPRLALANSSSCCQQGACSAGRATQPRATRLQAVGRCSRPVMPPCGPQRLATACGRTLTCMAAFLCTASYSLAVPTTQLRMQCLRQAWWHLRVLLLRSWRVGHACGCCWPTPTLLAVAWIEAERGLLPSLIPWSPLPDAGRTHSLLCSREWRLPGEASLPGAVDDDPAGSLRGASATSRPSLHVNIRVSCGDRPVCWLGLVGWGRALCMCG